MDRLAQINEAQILNEISSDLLLETTRTLAQWVRHSGTAQERDAVRYVKQILDTHGLRTTLFEHPALISYPIRASLAVIGEEGRVIQSFDCLGTALSVSAELEAELV